MKSINIKNIISYLIILIILIFSINIYVQKNIIYLTKTYDKNRPLIFIDNYPNLKYKTACSNLMCKGWEKINILQNQDSYYISYPNNYTPNKSLILFYIHGQNELITSPKYKQKLQLWSRILNKKNNILIAPNLFQNNITSPQAFNEIFILLRKYKTRFPYTRIYLLAFSMGGAIGYKIISNQKFVQQFDKIIIFAGSLPYNVLNTQTCQNIQKYKSKIRIYHGESDINVPIKLSTNVLVKFCKTNKYDINNSITYLENYDHWQLGYTKELYKYLNNQVH